MSYLLKILLLEDDLPLAETVIDLLEGEGYEVDWAKNSSDAIDKTYNTTFDLFLLDVNVPGMNGFSMLETLRKASIDTPAIFVTSLHDLNSLAKGFESGANDYLKKPFDIDELLIRIKALIRQNHKSRKNIISFEEFDFHIDSGELYKNKSYIALTEYEQRLLKLFMKHLDTTIVKDDILYEFSNGNEASEGALRVRINKLRNLGLPIQTVKGIGYRLEVKV